MCDYSLTAVATRKAAVGDKLITTDFGHGTKGFAGVDDSKTAVCVLPGTEIAFDETIKKAVGFYLFTSTPAPDLCSKVARFRQINKELSHTHHDALELPNGEQVLLTALVPGQHATVLQLPAEPKNEAEIEEQKRLVVAG